MRARATSLERGRVMIACKGNKPRERERDKVNRQIFFNLNLLPKIQTL